MIESPIFVRTYDFLLWLIPQTLRFPRVHRFGLGERIQRLSLDFQDTLVAAGKSRGPRQADCLRQADIQLEQIRLWMRFGRDNGLLSIAQYEHSARMLVEIGRLLGGWLKQIAGTAVP
jgi:hypothetical protein